MTIRIRTPDAEETPLSPDEIAVAIREGFHVAPGQPSREPVVHVGYQRRWNAVTGVESGRPFRKPESGVRV